MKKKPKRNQEVCHELLRRARDKGKERKKEMDREEGRGKRVFSCSNFDRLISISQIH